MAFDLGTIASTLLGSSSLNGIAKSTGASKDDISQVLSSALPLLLQGATKQSKSKTTAAGFAEALEQHAANSTSSLSSFFKNVDLDDGAKIVSHLLGTSTNSTAKKISKTSGLDSETVTKILAAAAPLVMSLLGKGAAQAKKADKASSTQDIAKALLGNVDVGSILTGLLKK